MNTPTPRTDAAAWPETDLVEGNFSRQLESELAAVTEQRDRLAKAIRKHKFCDVELYEALQSLNQNKP